MWRKYEEGRPGFLLALVGYPLSQLVRAELLVTDLERLVQRLELVADRLEGLLGERAPAPEPDPQAVEAAEKYIEKRKWELRGEEEPFDA